MPEMQSCLPSVEAGSGNNEKLSVNSQLLPPALLRIGSFAFSLEADSSTQCKQNIDFPELQTWALRKVVLCFCFCFNFLPRQNKALCSVNAPRNSKGGGRNCRGVRVAINTGREQFSDCVLHKHKTPAWEAANEPVAWGLGTPISPGG